tara:strand:+ start:10627 stop:11559 length:933 start_codon:yes stop_codon:yes gene_type:complete
MKKFLFLIFFLPILNIFTSSVFANYSSKIILKIENEILTEFEIRNKILSILILTNKDINQTNINELKKNALDSLIQYKLRKIEVSKYNFKDDPIQLNNYLVSLTSNNLNKLKDQFKENNLDYELFLDEIKTQFKWQKLIYQIYSKKIQIDEEILNKEIKEMLKKEKSIEEYKISEIEVSLNNDASDDKKINNLENLIKSEGFEISALKYSIAESSSNKGDIGWINSKSLSKEFYNTISALKIGEVSKPIIRQSSVLFFKLTDKKVSKSDGLNIGELRKNIINRKKNELFSLYSRSHLSKLKNNSLIEYKK